ncbi:MAG TPA: polysaccharide deacetylase [Candidatus Limnocylindrales bacterium]|jgi:peptidoglycan/xylan/chitin deacetylase (PgdA/CDA1 family)
MANPAAASRPRLTVALTFDHDAISDSVRRGDPPVKLSHGEFGPRVGMPRILALLADRRIPATWFVPGHTLEAFPDTIRAILNGGHELACHGWFHEDFATLAADEERRLVERCAAAVERVAGRRPAGWRAPYWSLGAASLATIAAAGFTYDSSLMADDYNLYRVRLDDRHSVEAGTRFGSESDLVEVPISWMLDDWPYFEPNPESGRDGLAAPSRVLEIWTEELRYAHAHAPGGLLTVTMHPECIGHGSRMAMLERFIDAAAALDGVVFDRLDSFVERWLRGASATS